MNNDFLAIDVGNSNIKYCLFDNGKKIITTSTETFSESFKNLKVVICSVNQEKLNDLLPKLKKCFNHISIISRSDNFSTNFSNNYKITIGLDRLCNLEAAITIHPESNILVIDEGTACTLSLIKVDKSFGGGNIIPGISTMLKSLKQNTADLPLVELQQYSGLLGLDTPSNIFNGVINSHLGYLNFMISELEKIHRDLEVIFTGGNAKVLLNQVNFRFNYYPELIFDGIRAVAELNNLV